MSTVRLTLGWIAEATSGRLTAGDPAVEIGQVVTDTRTLQPGDFFVALRGPRFDGHNFVAEARARGASGVLVARDAASVPNADVPAGCVEVDDTLIGLQAMAHAVRRAAGTRVIAITGSAGKTTTKETIAALLATRFRVVKNKGNLNNHIGLPVSLMQLREGPDVAVMELGMNHPGEIRTLVTIAEPDVRVWTNVGDAHLGYFASPDGIAAAKAEILERARTTDLLVANADDALVMRHAARFTGRRLTFGMTLSADVRAVDVEDLGIDGTRARIVTAAGEQVMQTPLLGRGNLYNLLAATAVGIDSGIALETIASLAETLQPAARRGTVRRLGKGVTLIDDSYNSSPAALRRALDVVAGEQRASRRIAVLGEMLELGEHAAGLHESCGRAAAAAGLRRLFTVGGSPARVMANAAVGAGMPASAVSYHEQSEDAAVAVTGALRAGDLVLVKGSRGVRTDVVADRIAAEFA